MRTSLATFSPIRAVKYSGKVVALALLILAGDLYLSTLSSPLKFAFAMEIVAAGGGLLLLAGAAIIVWRVRFDKGDALWLENGKIVYIHRWFQSANQNDVEHISVATKGISGEPIIRLKTRRGYVIEVHPEILSESQDIIVVRLREQLALR
jgi:hypothetical protein